MNCRERRRERPIFLFRRVLTVPRTTFLVVLVAAAAVASEASVAAVTVLPNAKLVSRARAKWEICEKKAQKLRYTRKKLRLAIQKQEKYERQELERQESLFRSNSEAPAVQRDETPEVQNGQPRTTATRINTDGSIESFSSDEKPTGRKPPQQEDESKTPELIKITKKVPPTSSLVLDADEPLGSTFPSSTSMWLLSIALNATLLFLSSSPENKQIIH